MAEFMFDRSRLERYQRCPRSYYWGYAYKGLGVAPRKRAIPLAFGGATHLGLETLLRSGGDIEAAINAGTNEYDLQARNNGLSLAESEDSVYVYNEQRALLEGLLWTWYTVRYPAFIREYELIDIEREELWQSGRGIKFMARADGVLRGRADESLYILSFKTAQRWDKKRDDEARSDIQGISELVAVEDRLGERVLGIQMEYLIKGSRTEYPKESGIYRTSNPLIRPWFNQNTGRYAHSWDWTDLDGRHTLGNKYRTVNIWETRPVREWVEELASGTVQPEAGSALGKWVQSPMPYMRNRDEINSWTVQARWQAAEMQKSTAAIEEAREYTGPFEGSDWATEFGVALDIHAPQHRHSCNYPSACAFKAICFGNAGPEPEEDPRFQWREPHHQLEIESLADATTS